MRLRRLQGLRTRLRLQRLLGLRRLRLCVLLVVGRLPPLLGTPISTAVRMRTMTAGFEQIQPGREVLLTLIAWTRAY